MKASWEQSVCAGHSRLLTLITLCVLALAASRQLRAQEALPAGVQSAAEAQAGNNMFQATYYSTAPISAIAGMRDYLDYGLLITPEREIVASTALLFDTEFFHRLIPIPRFRIQIGPKVYAAALNGNGKTNTLALALGGNVRFDIIPRIGLAAFGSAFYGPNVLDFGAGNSMYEFTAGGEVRVVSSLVGVAGYHWLRFSLANGPNDDVANQLFVGLRWDFR
jgi:YfaZ precursor